MLKVRNALAAGTMMAAALIAPMTTTAFAVADTTATPSSAQKPCSEYKDPQKCREWRQRHHDHHKDHWDHHRDHWDHHKDHGDHHKDHGDHHGERNHMGHD